MEIQPPMESTGPRNICGEHSHLWGAQLTGTPVRSGAGITGILMGSQPSMEIDRCKAQVPGNSVGSTAICGEHSSQEH